MKTLVTDKSNKYLLFVGCYRDDEMNADHHVSLQFNSMKEANVNFTKIQLGNMSVDSLTSFVSERLRLPRRLVKSLSEIVHRKSLGNAFFATMFLQVSVICHLFWIVLSRYVVHDALKSNTPRCVPKVTCRRWPALLFTSESALDLGRSRSGGK